MTEEIVSVAKSTTKYIDDIFYGNIMGEDKVHKDYKSFPVLLKVMKIGWILNDEVGKSFLSSIKTSDNMDYFNIQGLIMVIEYLYMKVKKIQLFFLLPLYLF